jgi:hypothetical protein
MSFAGYRLGALVTASAVLITVQAQAQYSTHTVVNARRVEVGQTFLVKFTAMSNGGRATVTDAKLTLPASMHASSPSHSSETTMDLTSGTMNQGLSFTWQVTASSPGKFKVGPPVMTISGTRVQGDAQLVDVVPAGTGGPGGAGGPSPFDPFTFMNQFGGGNFLPPGFFQEPQDQQAAPEVDNSPEDMRVQQAPDPLAFLHATLTPKRAVIGEQLSLRIYAYGSRGLFKPASSTEPTHADFLSYNVEDPDGGRFHPLNIAGTRFLGAKIRELALFPLHAGTLQAGAMKMGFAGEGYPNKTPTQGLVRESNLAEVIVSEPPLQGRPPGYKLGDVGDYTLNAAVDPRQIMAGDAVSVVATLSGVGNVPFKLITPEKTGVEWLEPSVNEHVEAKENIVQGSRVFTYVVRINQPGSIDLGELTLPFYDPKRHVYQIARAALGTVSVTPNPNLSKHPPDERVDRLASVLRLRKVLGAEASAQKPLGDRKGFWLFLLGAPLGVILSGGGLSLLGTLRERLRARGQSLSAQIELSLAEADSAASKDAAGTVAALERALFGAIELKLGLKARAVLKSELIAELAARGLPEPLAGETGALLEDCDALRFIGEPSGIRAEELVTRAERLVGELRAAKLTDGA